MMDDVLKKKIPSPLCGSLSTFYFPSAVLYYECVNLQGGFPKGTTLETEQDQRNTFIITFGHTQTLLSYLGPWSDSVCVFILVHSGDKWSDGAGGLARGHPDPSGYSTRWLRQRPGRLRPPLLTVSPSINEPFKCMDQQCQISAKKSPSPA